MQSVHHVVVLLIRPFCYGVRYTYGYSELYSTADKERSESQKELTDFSSEFSVIVVQNLKNEIRFDINFMVKDNQRDRRISSLYFVLYTINSMHIIKLNIISQR